jgi:hypothetical protein
VNSDWTLIGRGFGIATVGTLGVMSYILGLSNLYVGFFGVGAAYLVGSVLLILLFRRILDPFLNALGEQNIEDASGENE